MKVHDLEVSFQKRVVVAQYEHEEVKVSAHISLEDDTYWSTNLTRIASTVREHVMYSLGIQKEPPQDPTPARIEHAPDTAPVAPQATPARNQQSDPANNQEQSTDAVATDNRILYGTNKVRGNNANRLSDKLKELWDNGEDVPEEQIERLPEKYQKEFRDYIAGEVAQERAGPHDDPDPAEDLGGVETASGGGDIDDDLMSDVGSSGDTSQADDSSIDFDEDNIMGGSEPASNELEPIPDDVLKSRLAQFAKRLGGSAPIKKIVSEDFGASGAGQLEDADRHKLLSALEKVCKEKGV